MTSWRSRLVLRFPPIQLEVGSRPRSFTSKRGWQVSARGAYLRDADPQRPVFRAYGPSPQLEISGSTASFEVELENVHPEAVGRLSAAVRSSDHGSSRRISGELSNGTVGTASFAFPERAEYRFVAVGDTGAGNGLRRVLAFADQVAADFVLHLGDFFYGPHGEADVGPVLRSARVPVFAACGNHDFHGGARSRTRPSVFVREVGPLSYWFRLAGLDFLNLDTAAGFLPLDGGVRGQVLRDIALARAADAVRPPLVVFSHRPLQDPRRAAGTRGGRGGLQRLGENRFLGRRLHELGAGVVLAAHVHESWDFDAEGIRTLVAGQGEGRDNGPLSTLLGRFRSGQLPRFEWFSKSPANGAGSASSGTSVRRLLTTPGSTEAND